MRLVGVILKNINMPIRVDYSKQFTKQYQKATEKVQQAARSRIKLFLENSSNPLLHLHPLQGKYKGYQSINITGDWRALFREFKEVGLTVWYFDLLDTHSNLYK